MQNLSSYVNASSGEEGAVLVAFFLLGTVAVIGGCNLLYNILPDGVKEFLAGLLR